MIVDPEPTHPKLFWISGSPPSWRVMLALVFKEIHYESCLLEASSKEHKSPEYLAINPRGQVPTLRYRQLVVRESIAILAFLDRQWLDRPVFGSSSVEAANVWQAVMDFESNLQPAIASIAQILFRNQVEQRHQELIEVTQTASEELSRIENLLADQPYLAGDMFSAAECMLYPTLAWVKRALQKSKAELPSITKNLLQDRSRLDSWSHQVEKLPNFDSTYPPHWKN